MLNNLFSIRPAIITDTSTIVSLIGELAEYEKLAHEAVATPAQMAEHLFGNGAVAEVLIAEAEGFPVGFALYFKTFSTFVGKPGLYLEDLFVQPAFRRRGIGRALLAELRKTCIERGYGRLEWSVLDWNAPAIEFYKSLGAKPMDEWTVMRLTFP